MRPFRTLKRLDDRLLSHPLASRRLGIVPGFALVFGVNGAIGLLIFGADAMWGSGLTPAFGIIAAANLGAASIAAAALLWHRHRSKP
ncbi:hypothetical protein [Actinomadura sediminis]|uniref:Uncharacterized protein n=1 Tax=Actinomadura sediminis TaxID=1038904 RepID=A0ABW3EN48_9ACTN